MNRRIIAIACGTALLIAAAVVVVVASRNRQQPAPPLDVPVAASSAEVRVKAVVQKSATVGQPKSLSGVSRFGKTNLGFPVKLVHRNTGQVLYVLLPDLNSTLEVNGQILSSAFCSEDSFMQHLEDYRSLGVYIVTNMTNDIARDHLSTNGEWTVEAFRGTHEEQCIWDGCNLFHYPPPSYFEGNHYQPFFHHAIHSLRQCATHPADLSIMNSLLLRSEMVVE